MGESLFTSAGSSLARVLINAALLDGKEERNDAYEDKMK